MLSRKMNCLRVTNSGEAEYFIVYSKYRCSHMVSSFNKPFFLSRSDTQRETSPTIE
jgi:hypothetical protein